MRTEKMAFRVAADTRRSLLILAVFALLGAIASGVCFGQRTGEPIWSPLSGTAEGSNGTVYFRKAFTLVDPAEGELRVETAGDFELFVNSKSIHKGRGGEAFTSTTMTQYLQPGLNLIAISVAPSSLQNSLACYFRVREKAESRWRSVPTDETWLTSETSHPMWQSASFPDRSWIAAKQSRTPAGISTAKKPAIATANSQDSPLAPAKDSPPAHQASSEKQLRPLTPLSKDVTEKNSRFGSDKLVPLPSSIGKSQTLPGPDGDSDPLKPKFTAPSGFEVQGMVSNEECGSVIAMAFDEIGQLLLSRETGGLIRIDMTLPPTEKRTIEICNDVTGCQGILPLNGDIYVTGKGPQGLGLYELKRSTLNGDKFKISRALMRFTGEPGEHGPHGCSLGPDGKIYVIVGNGSQLVGPAGNNSPFRHPIDFDLVPRVNDPGGHATGVAAPGGTVVRIGLDGKNPEIVAGGIRNAYDLAFNANGDMFVHDSDMESDLGMAWHRSTQLFHVPMGGDLGWRSGWANCPSYCFDTNPSLVDTGRGSPTGAACYRHFLYPARYHDALFLADWSEGRILVARINPQGNSYSVETEEFLTGRPMNVTDLAIGEDGTVYFCTGGRGTWGGVFRVQYTGSIPDELLDFESDLARVLRMPQPDAAWARQNVALLGQSMGANWAVSLTGAALETRNSLAIRLRALDTIVLYGGTLSVAECQQLLNDADPTMRARICRICSSLGHGKPLLATMLQDESPMVRLSACEAILSSDMIIEPAALAPLLGDEDRNVSLAAMRLLQRSPVESWFELLVKANDTRISLVSSMAALSAKPNLAQCYEILAQCSVRMKEHMSDRNFTDMLRVIQVALAKGQIDPAKIPAFVEQIKSEFPSVHPVLNAELAKILVSLKAGNLDDRWSNYLATSTDPEPIRVQTALYLSAIANQLSDQERIAAISLLHKSLKEQVPGNRHLYLAQGIQKMANELSPEGSKQVLDHAAEWPLALVPVLYKLEGKLDLTTAEKLISADKAIRTLDAKTVGQARMGIVALLAESGHEPALDYLRQLWKEEESRRMDLTIGLAQHPDGKNWSYLVASLPLLGNDDAAEILSALLKVQQKPVDARHYRDLIELGYRLNAKNGLLAAKLVDYWAEQPVAGTSNNATDCLGRCTEWFGTKWPDVEPVTARAAPVSKPAKDQTKDVSMDSVIKHLETAGASGNPELGMHLFVSARCADCHRFGTIGNSNGPDLTSLASRFSKRETLEAIMQPHKVVPSHYRATLVTLVDGTSLTGLLTDNGDDSFTMVAVDGTSRSLAKAEIDQKKLTDQSAMPEGSLSGLSNQQISDLFAYMYGATSSGIEASTSSKSTQPVSENR